FLLLEWRSRVVRQLVLAGVRAFDFEFVEEQRRANDGRGHSPAAIADERVIADSDEIAAQSADIELAEHGATNQLLMPIRVDAIQKPWRIAGAERVDAISIWFALLGDHLQYFLLQLFW